MDLKTSAERVEYRDNRRINLFGNRQPLTWIECVSKTILVLIMVFLVALICLNIQKTLKEGERTQQQARLPFTRMFETPGYEMVQVTRK